MEEGDSVPLASIKNDTIRSSARWLLDHLQKADADAISAADIETQKKNFLRPTRRIRMHRYLQTAQTMIY